MKRAKVSLEDRIQALAALDPNFRKENGSQYTDESWVWRFRCGDPYVGIPAELVLYPETAFITTFAEDDVSELFGSQVPAAAILKTFHQKVSLDLKSLKDLKAYIYVEPLDSTKP